MSKRPSKSELEAFWDFADTDKNGELTIQEFKKAVHNFKQSPDSKCAPPSDKSLVQMFSSCDDNNDHRLSRDEYFRHVDREENNMCTLKEAFNRFDKDGDGTISRDELRSIIKSCPGFNEDALEAIMRDCDKDGDGKINFDEFLNSM